MDGDSDAPLREKWHHAVCDRGPLPKFSVDREPRSARAMRENGGTGDLADIIFLEEEDLPFLEKKKAGSFIDQLFLLL